MSETNVIPEDLKVDDPRKVFVSRVPRSFDGPRLQKEMEDILGAGCVETCDILWDNEEDRSRGSAFVVFKDQAMRSAAVKHGTFKVSTGKKNQIMHVAEVERQREGRGRDGGVCFLWRQGTCTHGDSCRFAHSGEGSCLRSTKLEPKKKKCFAYKKGKCKAGDACPFRHVGMPKTSSSSSLSSTTTTTTTTTNAKDNSVKACFNWLKKGKCNKGDKCPYNHETAEETASRKAARDKKDKKSTKKRKRQENSRPGDSGVDGPNYAPLTVRVFGLSYDSTEADVRKFFKTCGTITSFDMPLWEDSGRSKGFCELKFLSEENVRRAVAFDGDELHGRWLRIQRGKMFSSWGVKKGTNESGETGENGESGGTKRKRIVGAGGGGGGEEGGSSSSGGGNPSQSKTIFLGNLDWSLSKRALRRACDALYGKVTSVRMQKPDKVSDTPSGGKTQNTGYAHVTFAELVTAEKAVSMNGEELLGRKATVDWA